MQDALYNIELVSSNNNLLALVQSPECLKLRLYTGPFNVPTNPLGVDADRAMHDSRDVTFDVDYARVCLIATDTHACGSEMTRIGVSLYIR